MKYPINLKKKIKSIPHHKEMCLEIIKLFNLITLNTHNTVRK